MTPDTTVEPPVHRSPPAGRADAPATERAGKWREFRAGARATLPLVIGAAPFGLIFGAVAVNSGLSVWATAALSLFVFAGASQFVAAGLVASGAGVLIIVLTTFVVNLRHSLYAVTLSPYVKHLPQRWLLPLGFSLTDETFLVAVKRYQEGDSSPEKHWYQAGSALFMYLNWQVWTLAGIFAGQALPDPGGWGLDFALVVTFVGMLVPGLRTRPLVVCALAAGVAAVLLAGLPNRLGLLAASLVGVAAGVLVDQSLRRGRAAGKTTGGGAMNSYEWWLVAGMFLVTFGVRYPVLALVSKVNLPPSLLEALKFIPPAVLSAIIFPAVLQPQGAIHIGFDNAYLVAAVAAALISWRSKNLLLTIVLGMAIFLGWRWLW